MFSSDLLESLLNKSPKNHRLLAISIAPAVLFVLTQEEGGDRLLRDNGGFYYG